ncbi:M48 family metallopeptidase [Pseudazoarcus pumilus]|uniref:M48 family metallopeptidase n=1 Tax=Pseudazoarcus pumilus TaxID=2067960 RepID=UPI001D172798|nr:SprT family zinc-dependent metalloprotease [Pseudazoarcus pumilus]
MIFGLKRRRGSAPASVEQASVELAGRRLDYRLRRSARRTLALRVDHRGVQVSAPQRLPEAEIEAFLLANHGWLERKLGDLRSAASVAAFEAVDGALFPLEGRPARLVVVPGRRRACWSVGEDGVEELWLGDGVDTRAALLRALKARATERFTPRLAEYCARLGRAPVPLRLTSARTRWGSCSTRSGIRLHWRLIHVAPALADYVIAHEVAHLAEMNHSPRFWQIVEALYPNWREARRALAEVARTLPAIDARDTLAPEDM